jgi:tetraacyldisaccharide 4'-kinase
MHAPSFWWQEPGTAAALLAPVASIYGAVAAARLRQTGERAGVPVLCVGNPTVGGSGKTPTALALARLLIDAGERPFLLSRGYGGRLAGPVRVDPQHHRADDVGDEPRLLARGAPTVIARDRVAGARVARSAGAGVIVLDDGFQNPSLAKDLSILVIDGRRGIGNGRVFPAGPLRAPLAAQFDRAQAVLIIGEGPTGAVTARDAEADRAGLSLVTTEKDFVRISHKRAFAALAARSRVLPVALEIEEEDRFRRLVLAAVAASRAS